MLDQTFVCIIQKVHEGDTNRFALFLSARVFCSGFHLLIAHEFYSIFRPRNVGSAHFISDDLEPFGVYKFLDIPASEFATCRVNVCRALRPHFTYLYDHVLC